MLNKNIVTLTADDFEVVEDNAVMRELCCNADTCINGADGSWFTHISAGICIIEYSDTVMGWVNGYHPERGQVFSTPVLEGDICNPQGIVNQLNAELVKYQLGF